MMAKWKNEKEEWIDDEKKLIIMIKTNKKQ